MHVVGIDENGLGPVLGPLVVTAAHFQCAISDYDPPLMWSALGRGVQVADSKQVLGFSHMCRGEATVLGLLSHLTGRHSTDDICLLVDLLEELPPELRVSCTPGATPLCWGLPMELPIWSDPETCAQVRQSVQSDFIERLTVRGIVLKGIKSLLCCPKSLNQALADQHVSTKSHLDFALFERLITRFFSEGQLSTGAPAPGCRELSWENEEPVLFLCGKIGSARRYAHWFSSLKERALLRCLEQPDQSRYQFRGFEIRFQKDADDLHMPVALASMVGKYVRELFVERLNRFFCSRDRNLKPASGYVNRVTRQFIEQTAEQRSQLRIPEECFQRSR